MEVVGIELQRSDVGVVTMIESRTTINRTEGRGLEIVVQLVLSFDRAKSDYMSAGNSIVLRVGVVGKLN